MKNLTLAFCMLILAANACSANAAKPVSKLEIHDLQGCSHTSPYAGKQVSGIEGIVTHKISNGFTMQTLQSDDLDCSSEAIFVFTKSYPGVMVADLVSVEGLVEEFADGNVEDHNLTQTEITQPHYKVEQSDMAMPAPIILDDLAEKIPQSIIENDTMDKFDPSEDGLDFYESLESMLVEVRSGSVVAPRNSYDEIFVVPSGFGNFNSISEQGAILNSKTDSNPEKLMVKLPDNFHDNVQAGNKFESPILGIMDYSYGDFKLLAFSPVEFIQSDPVVDPFEATSKGLNLATYNLENLSPLDEANKFTQISRQIVKSLNSPDILVLNEVMDNSGSVDDGVVKADQTISKLISAIQKAGGPKYSSSNVDPYNNQDGGIEGGNIRTVLLFRSDQGIQLEKAGTSLKEIVFINSSFAVKENPLVIGEFSTAFNGTRKPRLWLLNQDGRQFFVVGVHLTSQGANSPDWGNLQPPIRPEESQRIEQARLINQLVSTLLSMDPTIPVFIAGDMNDMPWSDAITALEANNFISAVDQKTESENYSYIFDGNAQELDYVLINKNLASNLLQARFIHLNTWKDQQDKVSDHDPMIIEYQWVQSAP